MRGFTLFSAVALTTTALTPTFAQNAQPEEGVTALSDIVVTAQRREQKLTQVPISISALSSDTIARQQIINTLDIPKMVAGMTVSHNGLWVTPAIRGIGTRVGENSVSQYVDGVYIANPVTALNEFAAVERVEVLKGPQGTLFGRNATGGAINIITPDPTTSGFKARGSAFLEERGGWGGTAYLNLPISDVLALNISGNYRETDGWVKQGRTVPTLAEGAPLNPAKHSSERVKLKFTPNDGFDAMLSYWHGALSEATGVTYAAISNQLLGYTGPAPRNRANASRVPLNRAKFDQVALKLNKSIGDDLNLSSLTAYRDDKNTIRVDVSQTAGGIIAAWDSTQKTLSQEFILTGKLGNLDATFGLFLYRDKFVKDYVGALHYQKTTSAAPFTDLTYNVSDRLRLIGGLRYTYEKREFRYRAPQTGTALVDFTSKKSYNNVAPRAVIQYDLDDYSNVYVSVSRGFKSGLFNTDATGLTGPGNPAAQPLEAEKLTSYEVGYKLGTSRVNLALAGFYLDWKNIQTNRYINNNTVAQNGASAEVYGAEAQLTIQLARTLSANFNGSWLHGRYKDFPDGSASVQGTAGNLYDLNNLAGRLAVATAQDWGGLRLINAPDFSLNAGFSWDIENIGPGKLTLSPSVRYSSKHAPNGILLDTSRSNLLERKALTLVDMNIDYNIGAFTISAYARNLLDKTYYAEPNYNGLGVYGVWGEPQTFGARVSFKY